MYTLFGSAGSGSAMIEAALVLTGASYQLERSSSWEPDSALERLRAVNPLLQIPTLVLTDGSVLTESAAILIHLGLQFPDSPLLPQDPARRAQALRGMVFIAANCYSAIGVIDYPERWCADIDESARERMLRGARARLHGYWDLFADTFAATPFLSGEAPGGLDLMAAVVSKWSGTRKHLARARPKFLATLARIERHPQIAPIWARHWPDPP